MHKLIISLLCSLLAAGAARAQTQRPPGLTITHLTGDLYTYITYGDAGGGHLYPSNSMYAVTTAGIVLMDTPWDSTQFQPLMDSLEARHHMRPVFCISTHFHADRTAGLNFFKQQGVATWSTQQTKELCRQRGEPQAVNVFAGDTTFVIGNHSFRAFYPGAGHAPDNIVLWFGKEKVLYGGCFVKSMEAKELGNLSDADPEAWVYSMKKVIKDCPRPAFVIPGHLGGTDKESLMHTLMLLDTYKRVQAAEKYNREKGGKKS